MEWYLIHNLHPQQKPESCISNNTISQGQETYNSWRSIRPKQKKAVSANWK